MKLSIRTKLILFTVCVVLLVGGSIALHSFSQGRELIVTNFERDARETAALIAGSVANDLYHLDVHSLRVRVESAVTNPDIRYIYVMDKEGVVLADNSNENALRNKKLSDNFSREMLLARNWISRLEAGRLIVGGPVLLPDGDEIGYLQIGYSLDLMSQIVRGTTRSTFQITVIFLGVGVVLAVLFSVSFSRPIFSIMQASKEIGEGKLDTRLLIKRADELGRLAGSVNRMAEALQKRQIETEQKTRELQALYSLTNTINRSLNLDSFMQTALATTIEVLKADAGRLYIIEEKDRVLRLTAHHGLPTEQVSGIESYAPGEGIVGRTFKEKRPMVFADMTTDPKYAAMARGGIGKRWGFHSAAGIPITVKDQPVGVIYIYGRAVREFTQQDVELLSAIGDQIGVAVENARLFQETEQRARQQEALNAIASATSESLDLKELFEIASDKTAEVTGRERVNIRLKDPLTGTVNVVAYRGFSEEEIEELRRGTPNHPMSEKVFASGNPLIINEAEGDRAPDLFAATRSVAWIPIKAKAKVVGVLGISDNQSKPFLPNEIKLLEAIGSIIGVAIENARLFTETKRNLEGIRALHEIDVAIISTLDLRGILDVLMEKIDLFLPHSTATVRLFNQEGGLLEPVACRNLDEKEWKLEQWRAGRGPANAVFETKAPVIIRDCYTDPRIRDPGFFRKHALASYLGVPMIAKEENLGVLSFYTKEEHEYTAEEVEFLSTLAGQAAIAVHNSQLYERLRQKVQELQQKTEELERADKVKDEFLSVMSHELRTPLNVVMGYTAMIKDGMFGETNPEQEGALENVLGQANDLLTMITSILYATSIETQELRTEPHRFALGDFLNDLRTAYDIPRDKALALRWTYPPDLPGVETDREKLKYILHNLIHNAIKFTDRGQVTISARIRGGRGQAITDGDQQPANGKEEELIEFKVADTGIGISQEKLPLIFEKFHQIDSSDTRPYGGIGLGLYVAKNFTELLGGKIELETEQGKGSTFTVNIPCVIGSAATDGNQEKEQ